MMSRVTDAGSLEIAEFSAIGIPVNQHLVVAIPFSKVASFETRNPFGVIAHLWTGAAGF